MSEQMIKYTCHMQDALVKPEARLERSDSKKEHVSPKKSAQALLEEAKSKAEASMSAFKDLLEVTSLTSEYELPISPQEAAAELVNVGIVEPLVQWMDVSRPPLARLYTAGVEGSISGSF